MMNKILVAYFSASGTTARVAQALAKTANAALYEIKPAQPYTAADLNWQNQKSRSSVETNTHSRPALADTAADLSACDTVLLGFPIWWYSAPMLIHTFLESYDFSGKTVIPFATSGGSGMGHTSRDLAASCPGADVREGRRFSASVSGAELQRWLDSVLP